MYRICVAEASDDDVAGSFADLHQLTFFDAAAMPRFDIGTWCLVYLAMTQSPFADVVSSTHVRHCGYFSTFGVLRRH